MSYRPPNYQYKPRPTEPEYPVNSIPKPPYRLSAMFPSRPSQEQLWKDRIQKWGPFRAFRLPGEDIICFRDHKLFPTRLHTQLPLPCNQPYSLPKFANRGMAVRRYDQLRPCQPIDGMRGTYLGAKSARDAAKGEHNVDNNG